MCEQMNNCTATLPALRQSVHAFTLTPATVFLHSGKECVVKSVTPVDLFGKQTAAVIHTACGHVITFKRNSPNVTIVF